MHRNTAESGFVKSSLWSWGADACEFLGVVFKD